MVPMSVGHVHGMHENVNPPLLPVKSEPYRSSQPYTPSDLHQGYYQAFSLSNDFFAIPSFPAASTRTKTSGSLQSCTQAKTAKHNAFQRQLGQDENENILVAPSSMLTVNRMTIPTIPHIPDILTPHGKSSPPRLPLRELRLPNNNWTNIAEPLLVCANMDHGYVSPNALSPLTDSSSDASTLSSNLPDDIQSNISDIIDEVLKLEKNDLDTSPIINISDQNFNRNTGFTMTVNNEIGALSRAMLNTDGANTMKESQKHVSPVNFEPRVSPEQRFQVPAAASSHPCNTPWWHQLTQIHQHSDDMRQTNNNIRCLICGKQFQTKNNLKMHLNCHSVQRPFVCTYCDKRFTQKSTLRTHIRTHTGEKPYVCEWCARAFSDYSTYRKHRRIHTGERPYVCDVCLKGFAQSGNMIRHREIHFKRERHSN